MRLVVWGVVAVTLGLVPVMSLQPNVIDGHMLRRSPMSARADLISIAQAIDDFHTQKGRYPATLIELVVPGESGATFLTCTSVPKDPWKREYVYAPPDPEHHRVGILLSWGRDGKPGGEGDDGDIVQWIQLSETGSPK